MSIGESCSLCYRVGFQFLRGNKVGGATTGERQPSFRQPGFAVEFEKAVSLLFVPRYHSTPKPLKTKTGFQAQYFLDFILSFLVSINSRVSGREVDVGQYGIGSTRDCLSKGVYSFFVLFQKQ